MPARARARRDGPSGVVAVPRPVAGLARRVFRRHRAAGLEAGRPAASRAAPAAGRDGLRPAAPPRPLRERFPDLRRHFVFEYYPWYGVDPWRHWDQWERVPPHDLASTTVPKLGAYDSLDPAVLERHAQWIAESGAGAVNVSWWGPGSDEDRAVHLLMDVMRAHDVKVTFHLEPYADDRAARFADDVSYLVREYGERRGFDALLLLRNEDGREGPVFKGFRTILPDRVVDCRGRVREVPDHTPDDVWRRETDQVRERFRSTFDHVTLLADSLHFGRTPAAGFDGIAIYDNFVAPETYADHAAGASARGLLFSLNANPGYDAIVPRTIEDECFEPPQFLPPTPGLDFATAEGRERAAARAAERLHESLAATLAVQQDPLLENVRRGFLLVYLTSFNEWHEGHAIEPMKDHAELSAAERAFGYHNPERGDGRLQALKAALAPVLAAPAAPADRG
ncbi:MAG: hypothetical protein KJ067_20200 [Vicinamibacteria bacterium]|nr:hypothetical protein [Vicinamibacteria bacterium]